MSAAESVLVGDADRTVVRAPWFDAMTAGLDDQAPVPEVVALASRPRRIARA